MIASRDIRPYQALRTRQVGDVVDDTDMNGLASNLRHIHEQGIIMGAAVGRNGASLHRSTWANLEEVRGWMVKVYPGLDRLALSVRLSVFAHEIITFTLVVGGRSQEICKVGNTVFGTLPPGIIGIPVMTPVDLYHQTTLRPYMIPLKRVEVGNLIIQRTFTGGATGPNASGVRSFQLKQYKVCD